MGLNLVFIFILLFGVATASNSAIANTLTENSADLVDCGLPATIIGYPYFASLNVQVTPQDYTQTLARPIADPLKVGKWKNGNNCGKFVRVTLGDFCLGGTNTGVPGTSYCQGGRWTTDTFNGAYQDFLIVQGCQKGDLFCRDDTNHVSLSSNSLNQFILPSGSQADVSTKWNNRKVTWDFISKPFGTIPFKIYWAASAQISWPQIIIVGIQGIKQVLQIYDSAQKYAQNQGDKGLVWVLDSQIQTTYSIRITDQAGAIYPSSSSTYNFQFPASCQSQPCQTIIEVLIISGF